MEENAMEPAKKGVSEIFKIALMSAVLVLAAMWIWRIVFPKQPCPCKGGANGGKTPCGCGGSPAPQQPVYAAPQQPVYAAPQPVYAAPQQPVYAAPQPVYAAPQQPEQDSEPAAETETAKKKK